MNMGDADSYNFILSDLIVVSTLTRIGQCHWDCSSLFVEVLEAAVGFLPIILIPNIAFSSLFCHSRYGLGIQSRDVGHHSALHF